MISSYIFQIFLRVTIQNQVRIAQRVIVDEVIQFRPLRHSHIQRIRDSGAVDGNFSSIPEQQLHAAGVQPLRCAKMCRAKISPLKQVSASYTKPEKRPGSSPKRQLRSCLFRSSIKCTSTTMIHGRDSDNRTATTLPALT